MPFDVGLLGKLLAGAVIGLGAIWWIIKRLNRAEADRIEAISHKAWTQGRIEADAAVDAATTAVITAKEQVKNAPPTDW